MTIDRQAGRKSDPPGPRERILATAARLFYREGTLAVGVDRLIAEAGVAKASFYRYFPAKDDLVAEYLRARHQRWMGWFGGALHAACEARGFAFLRVAEVLGEWFVEPDFRGCAFINVIGEGAATTRSASVARTHKQELLATLSGLARRVGHRSPQAVAGEAMLVVEGAIVRAMMESSAEALPAAQRLFARLDSGAQVPTGRRAARRA
jgi:AcrR family transcriptional regulator